MSRIAGCCRFVWNKALAIQKERIVHKNRLLSYVQMAALLVEWKKEFSYLQEAPSQPLQQTLKNLDRALRESFNKNNPKRFPRFKNRYMRGSFLYPQGHKVEQTNTRMYLPKIGWVRYRSSKTIEGLVKNVVVSRHCGRWYVSVQVEQEIKKPDHTSSSAIGLDVGIAKFATCSDGMAIEPLNSFRRHEQRLAFLQRGLARKIKFSQNWFKQKYKISRCHTKISYCRKDFLHKITDAISKNHAIVVMEELKIANMSRSAKGTIENPGKNVHAKSGLNKAILDQGWHEFRRQLEYKMLRRGGKLIFVNPRNTSRTCSKCGHCEEDNRKTQEQFICLSCGHKDNADLNAAKNILAAGLAVIASGGYDLSQPVKEEPAVLKLNAFHLIQSESSCFS